MEKQAEKKSEASEAPKLPEGNDMCDDDDLEALEALAAAEAAEDKSKDSKPDPEVKDNEAGSEEKWLWAIGLLVRFIRLFGLRNLLVCL